MEKESEYGIFRYQELDKHLIDELSAYFDEQAKTIIKFFNINDIFPKVIINIIPTKKELDKVFKKEYNYDAPRSTRGICLRDGSINYLSINDYKSTTHAFEKEKYEETLDGFKKTLIHEYVHYVNMNFNIQNNCGPTAIYLREGIAIYLSKQKENIALDFNYSLEQILETDVNKRSYEAYYLVTKYLVENYDKDFVIELFKSNRQANEFLKNQLYNKTKEHYVSKKK